MKIIMIKKDIRKALLETKEKKETLLIERTIIKNRILMVVEDVNNIKNFNKLPYKKRNRLSESLLKEFIYLERNGLLNEGFMDILSSLFGNVFGRSAVETIAEPLIDKVLTSFGFTSEGILKKTMISFLTSNPKELIKAMGDCRLMTKLLIESFIEGIVMMIQQQTDKGGFMYDYARNTLGGLIKGTSVVSNLEGQLSGKVCGMFSNLTGKAEDVADKLSGGKPAQVPNGETKEPVKSSEPGVLDSLKGMFSN